MNQNINKIYINVTQIKSGKTINVGSSGKAWMNIICAKMIIFGILLHALSRMVNI